MAPAAVHVSALTPGSTLDHSRSRSDLAGRMSRVPFAGFSMQGLTVLDYATSYRMSVSMTEIAPGRWCASLEKVEAEFGLRQPAQVMVASEVEKGSCHYRTVLSHEMQHVSVGENNARSGARDLQAAIRALAAGTFPVEAPSREAAYAKATKVVEKVVNDTAATSINRADRENAALDTRESYMRLTGLCG